MALLNIILGRAYAILHSLSDLASRPLSLAFAVHKMSEIEIPPFDLLNGSDKPTDSFGIILENTEYAEALLQFEDLFNKAKESLAEIFNFDLSYHEDIVNGLDAIISEMWSTGWDPNNADLNLYCSHFGVILAFHMGSMPNVRIVMRSLNNLNHLSVWHEASKSEYFPFHKIVKCLTRKHGESIRQMVDDLKQKEFGEHLYGRGSQEKKLPP